MTAQQLLDRAVTRLVKRVAALEARVDGGDEAAWPAYLEAAQALAVIARAEARGGKMLTTEEAARLWNITPAALRRKVARGELKPAVKQGNFMRWSGREAG